MNITSNERSIVSAQLQKEYKQKIKDTELAIKQHTKAIESLKNAAASFGIDYVQSATLKRKLAIEACSALIITLNNKVEKGNEEELASRVVDYRKNEGERVIADTARHDLYNITHRSKKDIDKLFVKDKKDKRDDRNIKKDMDRHYKYYWNAVDSLPPYIGNNLAEMTNNKGYIWKGTIFYGKLPAKPGENVILFEKYNSVLRIHDISDTVYSIYEKQGRDPRKLISMKKRKQIKV